MTTFNTTEKTIIKFKNSDGNNVDLSIDGNCDLIDEINKALFLAGNNTRIRTIEPSESNCSKDENGNYIIKTPEKNIIKSIQKRSGMYINRPYITDLFQDLMLNEVNLFKNKKCTEINVIFDKLGCIEISNDGIGLDNSYFDEKTSLFYTAHLPYVNSDDKGDDIEVFGTNYSINVVSNALSEKFYFKTTNKDFTYSQNFKNGIASNKILKEESKGTLGTQIIFTPNKKVFKFEDGYTPEVDHAESIAFLHNISMLNSGLTINLTDINGEKTKLHYKNGMESLLKHKFKLSEEMEISTLIYSDPINNESINISFVNTLTNEDFEIVSFINDFHTRNGGGHVDGFVMALNESSEHLGIDKRLTGIKAVLNLNAINFKLSSHHDRLITRNEKNRVCKKLKKII
jgi:DNA gyrase subunit B